MPHGMTATLSLTLQGCFTLEAAARLLMTRRDFLPSNSIAGLFIMTRNANGMTLTGRNHAPFSLRHRIDDGDRCLSVTVVIDTRERWMYRNLAKVLIHLMYLTFAERLF